MSRLLTFSALITAGALSYGAYTYITSKSSRKQINEVVKTVKDTSAQVIDKVTDKLTQAAPVKQGEEKPETPVSTDSEVQTSAAERMQSASDRLIALSGSESEEKAPVVIPVSKSNRQDLQKRKEAALQKQLDIVEELSR